MNIAFFLTPKREIIYESMNTTMRQTLERMEYHRYTAVPILDGEGKYVGTLTQGDLLWKLKNNPEITFKNLNKIRVQDITMSVVNNPVRIDSNMEDLFSIAVSQNFIPVVDDNNIFIGIIKRSVIMNYCYEMLFKKTAKEA
ncbi:MAG TPA: CBS domain-containing protein [Clostridiaceae bacterium]